ncbi:Uncharacterised protein [uncultured archaeon]|nr:Uncharacterised protein [uncultured archaeon]
MKRENYGEFAADTRIVSLPEYNSSYLACKEGVYHLKSEARDCKVRYHETPIFPKKSELPIGADGKPISIERQDEIIRIAVERAKRRTQAPVLTLQRDFNKGTLAEKVA